MDQTQFLIPEALLKAMMAYLAARPYQEVAQAMQALQNLPRYEPPSANAQ
jgi:hypothetical protein